jgi:hypothetical protein
MALLPSLGNPAWLCEMLVNQAGADKERRNLAGLAARNPC